LAKFYGLRLSTAENGASFTGLTPTLSVFWDLVAGTTRAPASPITELAANPGFYYFAYSATTPIAFRADFGAGLPGGFRYVEGILDPIQAVDEKVGFTSDSIGSTSVDPSTIFGYAKRLQEFLEGNATYIKNTGVWNIYSRGSSTQLASKTLTDDSGQSTKS